MSVVAAILAAGSSQRLGRPKQLLRLPSGTTLVRHTAEQVLQSGAQRCAVVLGAQADAVEHALGGLSFEARYSEDPAEGVAASLRAAAAWATEERANALLLCVCDQPRIGAAHLKALISTWREEQCAVASSYADKRAVPAVLPSEYFPALRALRGDADAATLLQKAVRVELIPWPDGELDIDTPSDADKL
ncbi:MAG: nucleotidyltransferase family protein [Polyangiaceae bacterium]|nr:nucleotidyltransferase family protein [Polyangiaceae bacterium]